MTRWTMLALALLLGCGDDDGTGDASMDAGPDAVSDAASDANEDTPDASLPDHAAERPPLSSVVDGVHIETVSVTTPPPPANPNGGAETPADLHRVEVQRYRRDMEPAAEASAILVAMPGLLAGAGSLDGYARGVVTAAASEGTNIEVWVVERRGNLMEDLAGMDAAEVAGDAEIARDYYAGRATVGGESFAGYRTAEELAFMSEWGLATLVADVHAIIATVPEGERKAKVFLVGHSLGAFFVEAYARWRFEDESRGSDEVAGMVLLDGVLAAEPITESEYHEGITSGPFPLAGLDGVRDGMPNITLPFLGIDIYSLAEVLAMRAEFDGDTSVDDRGRDTTFRLLLGYSSVPALTNETAFALPFDDASGALAFARLGLGAPVGETESFTSILGDELTRPVGGDEAVAWQDGPEVGEASAMAEFTRCFFAGRTNYAQWYFPARLPLDLAAVGGGLVREDGYQASEGLRTFEPVDIPVLAVANGLIGDAAAFDALRARVAPVIGEGRPLAGAGRDVEGAFTVVDAVELLHLDPGVSSAPERNPAIGATLDFVGLNTN